MKINSKIASLLLLLASCNAVNKEQEVDVVAYQQEIDQWHQQRIEELKGDNGWLNLAGLFWLKEGLNTFGSAETNDLVFPKDKIADNSGFFQVKNGVVQMNVRADVKVLSNESEIQNTIIFHPDSVKNLTLSHGDLQWFVIKRDDQVGLRLRDLKSKSISEFTGIERYQVDASLRIKASMEVSSAPKYIDITNVLGQTTAQLSPATLIFELRGEEYRLDALEGGKDELFIIFGDQTNEDETYPSGRYLYIKIPDKDGQTYLDFNKSYNPPCAFTPFATCPLPPAQNVLPLAIKAGEKNFKGYSH